MRQPGLILLKLLILLIFLYGYISQFQIALIANNKYMASINALGISPSFMPMYIQMEQLQVAMAQPIHWVSTSALLRIKAPIMASKNPVHLQPSIFL